MEKKMETIDNGLSRDYRYILLIMGYIGIIDIYWDTGQENGNY